MNQYLAIFSPGFSEIVTTELERAVPDIAIRHTHEASIMFGSTKPYRDIASLPVLSQLYPVVASLRTGTEAPTGIVKKLTANARYTAVMNETELRPGRTFRLMVQQGNQLIGIPKDVTRQVHEAITSQTGMTHAPLKSDIEIWIIIRTEGYAYLCIKLPSHQPNPAKGELQPHLAHTLVRFSEPTPEDVFLDPFCGSGALPQARKSLPYRHIYAVDSDQDAVGKTVNRLKHQPNTTVFKADSRHLKTLKAGSINRIVTDPPWGIFNMKEGDFEKFYSAMLREMSRVLASGGISIVLTARTSEFATAFEQVESFEMIQSISTLVNGKKATAYKFRKF